MPQPVSARHASTPRKGDRRRAALLSALDRLLQTRSLREIGTAEITTAAGVTRSAFYFYFPTKGAAVAALLEDFYDELLSAAADWYQGSDTPPLDRLAAGFDASVALWRQRAYLLVAMLDAAGSDNEGRAVWEQWIARFTDRIAQQITTELAAVTADGHADPHALATVLMGAALHAMEHDVRAITTGQQPDDSLTAALVETWHRTIYAQRENPG